MNKVKIRVARVSEKTSNGNYIHTLKTEGKEIEFMGTKMKGNGLTYFVALSTALALDKQEEIDLDKFDIVERVSEVEDRETGELKEITTKWLYPKR